MEPLLRGQSQDAMRDAAYDVTASAASREDYCSGVLGVKY
jgi:hypothetical protein